MSLLGKRRNSFDNGEDEITVSRIRPDNDIIDFSQKSRAQTIATTRSSLSSETDASDYPIHDSCVLRNFPKHKSTHLRFLAWVAYTRKYTDEWITEDERRTCPLLWCRTVFKDQDEMLKHVYNCPHLKKNLYWCSHCQKPERVGKFQCKRCQGVPSKTDRMASVARKIFSKLGSKHHREDSISGPSEMCKPASRMSETTDSSPSKNYPQNHDWSSKGGPSNWESQFVSELPSTSVCPEMPANWTATSHELPDTYIAEMTGSEIHTHTGVGENWGDNFYSENLEDWDVSLSNTVKGKGSSPRLSLDTSVPPANIQPTYVHQENPLNSPDWMEQTLSNTMISPMSATEPYVGFDSYTLEVSPTDTMASGASFFADSGYSSASSASWKYSTASFEQNPLFGEKKGIKRSIDFGPISEEWANDADFSVSVPRPQIFALPSIQDSSEEVLRHDSVYSNHSADRCTMAPEKVTFASPLWSDATSLVHCFSEVLDAHLVHTKSALKHLPRNTLTQELLAMSKSSMVSNGLGVLAGLLEGRKPTAIIQVAAFVHVAYALAIAMDHDEAKIHTEAWFQNSLVLVEGVGSERQRQLYLQIAKATWQPMVKAEVDSEEVSLGDDLNSVIFTGCKHFLDVFESLQIVASPQPSLFDFGQFSFEQSVKSKVIDPLIQKLSLEAFIEDVAKIERLINQKQITSIRELELELICAGKLASQSERVYQRFREEVTVVCDSLYAAGDKKRAEYHVKDVYAIMSLLPMDMDGDEEEQGHGSLFDDAMDTFRENETEEAISAFVRDADSILTNASRNPSIHLESHPLSRNHSTASQPSNHKPQPTTSQQFIFTTPSSILSVNTPQPKKTDYTCPLCPYTPSGEEKWKASNLRRHKRTQHPVQARTFSCQWPGCRGVYSRSDNLRDHMRRKGHLLELAMGEVGDEVIVDREGKRRKIGERGTWERS